jgi:hypothetical protein
VDFPVTPWRHAVFEEFAYHQIPQEIVAWYHDYDRFRGRKEHQPSDLYVSAMWACMAGCGDGVHYAKAAGERLVGTRLS